MYDAAISTVGRDNLTRQCCRGSIAPDRSILKHLQAHVVHRSKDPYEGGFLSFSARIRILSLVYTASGKVSIISTTVGQIQGWRNQS